MTTFNSSHLEVISPLHLELFGNDVQTKWLINLDVQLSSAPLAALDVVDTANRLTVVEDMDFEKIERDDEAAESSGIGSSLSSSHSSGISSPDTTGASCDEDECDECDGVQRHQIWRQRYSHQIVFDGTTNSRLGFQLGDEIVCISRMCVRYWTHDAVRAQIACLGLAPLPSNFKLTVRDTSNHYCIISARIDQDGTLTGVREYPADRWDFIRKSLHLITHEDIRTEKVRLSPRGSNKYVSVVDSQVKLQPLTDDNSFVFSATLFHGYGVQCRNADYNDQLVCVLALSSSDADTVKFVCVRDESSVALQECPDLSTLIDKQMLKSEDSRFFYQIAATDGDYVVFESTQLPNHYLAWNNDNQVCIKQVSKVDRFKDKYLRFQHYLPV